MAKGFDRADYGLLDVAVDSWGLFVFVNLVAGPRAAGHPARRPAASASPSTGSTSGSRSGRSTYDVAANYKLIGENFMEYYHLPWVHPELNQVSKFSDHYRWQGPGMYTGMCTTPVSRNTDAGGWDGLKAAEHAGPAGRRQRPVRVAVPRHRAGRAAQPRVRAVQPTRSRRTAPSRPPSCWRTPSPSTTRAPRTGIEQLAKFWDLVNRQDLEIVERVQEGLENPAYRGGRMCFRFEEPLHRFQNMVIDKIVGIERVPGGDSLEPGDTMTRMFPDP